MAPTLQPEQAEGDALRGTSSWSLRLPGQTGPDGEVDSGWSPPCCRALRSRSENPVTCVLSRIRRPTGVRIAGTRAGSSISARPPCFGLRAMLPHLLPAGPGRREARHNRGRSQWVSGIPGAAVRAHWASSAPGTGSVTGQRALGAGESPRRVYFLSDPTGALPLGLIPTPDPPPSLQWALTAWDQHG